MKPFTGPTMDTPADVRVQRAREVVYDARWARHRDQTLIAIMAIVILTVVAATLLTGNVEFVAMIPSAPAVVFGAAQRHPSPPHRSAQNSTD